MQPRTVGVEEEFLLVDGNGVPRPVGGQVVAESERAARSQPSGVRRSSDDLPGVEHELQQEQAETGTRVWTSLDDLRADLVRRRQHLAAAAARHDVGVAAIGTSPFPGRPTITPDERYLRMTAEYGALAQQELTCGCHVHVGIGSRAEGAAVVSAIQPWLSVLLALSANSPFWQGVDTGYASYRRLMWDLWPTSGPTPPFRDEQDYDDTVERLIGSGVALDAGMVYFDARLSAKYPTVELRVADVCTDPDDAVLVAALARGLVDTAAARTADGAGWPVARAELLRGAAWRAARSGLAGDLVDPVAGVAVPAADRVARLVELVGPALERHGDTDRVETGVKRLFDQGTGADRQRQDFAHTGDLRDVVRRAAERTVAASA